MKAGRIFLAIIFFVLFIVCIYLLVKGWSTTNYASVFPEDVFAVIHIHKPMDVPLKVLNSTVAKKFFETEMGKEQLKTINEALGAMGGGGSKSPPPLYKDEVEGVTVFYVGEEAPAAEEEAAPSEEKAAPSKKFDLNELKKGMSIGGVIIKDIYVALHGNPASFGENPSFMVALDLGRIASLPGMALSGKAEPKPKDKKPKLAFAFIKNLVVLGDPDGVARMIHVSHNTPMMGKVTSQNEEGEEVSMEVALNTKPLGKSKLWNDLLAARISENSDFRLTLLVPNLMSKLLADPMTASMAEGPNQQFGLDKIKAFDLSTATGPSGLKMRISLFTEADQPIMKILDQPEVEMGYINLLPDGFLTGAGINTGNPPQLYENINEIMGGMSPLGVLDAQIKEVFGVSDAKEILRNLDGEVSIITFNTEEAGHEVVCMDVKPEMAGWLEGMESQVAEQAIAKADEEVKLARSAGAMDYAPVLMTSSEQELEHARNALAEENPVEAVASARKASEEARNAVKFYFIEAEKAIDIAESSDWYDYGFPNYTSEANAALEAAANEYSADNYDEAVKKAKVAYDMGLAVKAMVRANEIISNAREIGAATKAPDSLNGAIVMLGQAETNWKVGAYSSAKDSAEKALDEAKKALTESGGTMPEEMDYSTGDSDNLSLATPDSPREVNNSIVYITVGEKQMDYTFLNNEQTMCLATTPDMEAFLGVEKGKVTADPKLQELFKNIPQQVQGEVTANLYNVIKSKGLLEDLDEEMKKFVSGLNLMVGDFLVTEPTRLTVTAVLPVKLFDGSPGGGARSATTVVIFALKVLLYLFTILFLYLTVKMVMPKEKK